MFLNLKPKLKSNDKVKLTLKGSDCKWKENTFLVILKLSLLNCWGQIFKSEHFQVRNYDVQL